MRSVRIVAPMLVLGVLSSGFLMGDDKPTDKDPVVVRATLPKYYKSLGLSDKQKAEIYRLRGRYAVETKKLRDQIAALAEQEKKDLEGVLTAAQKARLKEILSGADKTRESSEEAKKPAETKKK